MDLESMHTRGTSFASSSSELPDDSADVEVPAWLNSDEALLREALPEHRPEYC